MLRAKARENLTKSQGFRLIEEARARRSKKKIASL